MSEVPYQRFVLLNRLVSRSSSRASDEHKPPIIGGAELLDVIAKRKAKGFAIEFIGVVQSDKDADEDEKKRIAQGEGHDFIFLRQIKSEDIGDFRYTTLLMEHVDQSRRSFSVVHTRKLTGREISGEEEERGGISAHVVIRTPLKAYDDGSYRCAIEVVPFITRSDIEQFLCRQLRRQSQAEASSYTVTMTDKKGKTSTKQYRYSPRLELFADIGRKLSVTLTGGRELAHMTFTKRNEKRSIGKATEADHTDIIADVELKVSAKQGPDDPEERLKWLVSVRQYLENSGYESRLYYRNISGGIVSGDIHKSLAGATDLVMCQRELISFSKEPKDWYSRINAEVVNQMISLLDKGELWERSK